MSFSPFNVYIFAAARGQFLRPDVQTLLKEAPVGLFDDLLAPRDTDICRQTQALRARLDLLLFAGPRPQDDRTAPLASNVVRLRP